MPRVSDKCRCCVYLMSVDVGSARPWRPGAAALPGPPSPVVGEARDRVGSCLCLGALTLQPAPSPPTACSAVTAGERSGPRPVVIGRCCLVRQAASRSTGTRCGYVDYNCGVAATGCLAAKAAVLVSCARRYRRSAPGLPALRHETHVGSAPAARVGCGRPTGFGCTLLRTVRLEQR